MSQAITAYTSDESPKKVPRNMADSNRRVKKHQQKLNEENQTRSLSRTGPGKAAAEGEFFIKPYAAWYYDQYPFLATDKLPPAQKSVDRTGSGKKPTKRRTKKKSAATVLSDIDESAPETPVPETPTPGQSFSLPGHVSIDTLPAESNTANESAPALGKQPANGNPIYGTSEEDLPPWVVRRLSILLSTVIATVNAGFDDVLDQHKITASTFSMADRAASGGFLSDDEKASRGLGGGKVWRMQRITDHMLMEVAQRLFGSAAVIGTGTQLSWAPYSKPGEEGLDDAQEPVYRKNKVPRHTGLNNALRKRQQLAKAPQAAPPDDTSLEGQHGNRVASAFASLRQVWGHNHRNKIIQLAKTDEKMEKVHGQVLEAMSNWMDANEERMELSDEGHRVFPDQIGIPPNDVKALCAQLRLLKVKYAEHRAQPWDRYQEVWEAVKDSLDFWKTATSAQLDKFGFNAQQQAVECEEIQRLISYDATAHLEKLNADTVDMDLEFEGTPTYPLEASEEHAVLGNKNYGISMFDDMDPVDIIIYLGFETWQDPETWELAKATSKLVAHM
jgi:hypothetical protein